MEQQIKVKLGDMIQGMRTETKVRQRKDGSFEARYKIGRNGRGRTAYF